MLKKPSKNGRDLDPKCNQFFLVHRYICGKIFTKIWSVVLREVANSNRQTNAGEGKYMAKSR